MSDEERNKVESSDRRKFWILILALGQYPLHTYMVFALRASNQGYLIGDSENEWGFGQVMAMVLVGPFFLECIRGAIDFKDELKKQIERGNESRSLTPSTTNRPPTDQGGSVSTAASTDHMGGSVNNNTPPEESIHSVGSNIAENDGGRALHRRRIPWHQQVKNLLGKFLWYPGTLRA
ncbi:hypothetical protein NW765_017738 [Fusarium oxysporum]|nr:hypothetical protein NW765_017738 [Fusarium oxysporum]KAJ4264706.1 hypothetical protein NW764_015791 [Fusarium oxysporum]